MLSGIGHVEMHVGDLAACRVLYGEQIGLKEIAHGAGPDGRGMAMFAIGDSVLELHEDPDAVKAYLPSGEKRDPQEVPGSVGHFAFYAENNNEVYAALKEKLAGNSHFAALGAPSVQPLDHAFLQRSLLQFEDPDGYMIQIADLPDPRTEVQARIAEKRATVASIPGLLRGIDHIQIICSDVDAARKLLGTLGLEELAYRTETEPPVEGFEESVMAAGMTELELTRSAATVGFRLGPGAVTSLGFWTDDVEEAYKVLCDHTLTADEPAELAPLGMPRRAFAFEGFDGLRLEVAQRM